MKKYTTLITAAVIALLLSVGIAVRMYMQKKQFDKTVHEALKTSEGYDQKFIDMVNRLEEELAKRASFGYKGGKDPMTGKLRTVVSHVYKSKKPDKGKPVEYVDPYKLTAIIFDDETRRHTAIVMMGERSFAVEVGDKVGDRRIQRITNERVYMEDDSQLFYYDISGKTGRKSKLGKSPQPPQDQESDTKKE